jgi:hypothetical protein
MAEIIKLVNHVILKTYEKNTEFQKLSEEELETLIDTDPVGTFEYRQKLQQRSQKKEPKAVAQEILNEFRKELLAGKQLIENDGKPLEEKQADLTRIEKALYNISYLTNHWVKKTS